MRVVLSALVASHLMPMIPLAWALRGAGHEVLVISDAEVARTAAEAGLSAALIVPVDVAPPDSDDPAVGRNPGIVRTEAFLPAYQAIARAWGADLLVTDPLDHAGWIVAGVLGVPLVVHRYGPDGFSTALHRKVREPLRPLAVAAGAAGGLPDPDLILDPCPPSLRSPSVSAGTPVRFVPHNGVGLAPEWALTPPTGRRVCVCLGMWGSNRLAGEGKLPDAFRHVIAALGDSDVEAVFPVPPALHPVLDELPDNIRLLHPVPINLLVRECAAVVHHGGAGTALTALAFGVPQLVLPPELPFLLTTAGIVADSGAGRALPGAAGEDAAAVAAALTGVLDDPAHRAAAGRLRAEILRQPSPADLVGRLERLAARPPAG